MKILIDAHLSEDKITGIGRYLNELVPALLSVDPTNSYTVLLNKTIHKNHPLYILEKENLNKVFIDLNGPSLKQHISIPKIINKINPDVYHHPHFDLPFRTKCKAVITVHDLKYIRHPEYFPKQSQLKSIYMRKKLRHSLKKSAQIIVVSNSTKKDIIDLFHTPENKFTVIHHGLSPLQKSNRGCSDFQNHTVRN